MPLSVLVEGQPVWLPGVAAIGVAVGFLAGMFGMGGAFLLTPLLSVLFRVPVEVAVGTGLCQMVGTSLAALLRVRRERRGERRFDLLMLAGALAGVDAGARTLDALSALGEISVAGQRMPAAPLVLKLCYAVLLAGSIALFWRQGTGPREALEYVRVGPLARLRLGPGVDLPAASLRAVPALAVAYVGLLLGFVSGLLGLGGGILLLPVLTYGFGFPIRQATGTGLMVLVASASVGTFLHALRGNVHLGLAMVLLVGATISAQLGVRVTTRLPARTLRRLFALVMSLAVLAILWDLARRLG